MISEPSRVVYDCNVLFQALISTRGPAHRCKLAAEKGQVILFVSDFLFAEIRSIASRPVLRDRFELDAAKVDAFLADVSTFAVLLKAIPEAYRHPIDPKDSHYVNLALAAHAKLIVSRDNHLLDLNNPQRPQGGDFQRRFPGLRVLDPVCFLRELDHAAAERENLS